MISAGIRRPAAARHRHLVVLTIAGLLSLYVIPVAQYPDIVPPHVPVTTFYPSAGAPVVDAADAPIEAQVIGVHKMMYMKSVSGDGSAVDR